MTQQLTNAEMDELMNWLAIESNKDQFAALAAPLLFSGDYDNQMVDSQMQAMIGNILKVDQQPSTITSSVPIHRIHLLKTAWFRFAAAAVIVIIIGGLIWRNTTSTKNNDQAYQQHDKQAPASLLATITLADGRQINLDSAGTGTIATEGNITIEKLSDGRIVYNGTSENAMMYNTISVPRGSRITSLTLSDGTIVWLNSASSLKYPVAFSTNERKVQISGEAYFEVTKNAKKQFIVESAGASVEVLGTSFNINSYDNETDNKITLVEGRVRVLHNKEQLILEPGQQAKSSSEKLKLVPSANIDDVLAWKNGKFYFDNSSIEEVMRELERWYDIETVFKEKPIKGFEGTIPRSLNIQNVLKILEATGEVKFEMKGNRVIVMK